MMTRTASRLSVALAFVAAAAVLHAGADDAKAQWGGRYVRSSYSYSSYGGYGGCRAVYVPPPCGSRGYYGNSWSYGPRSSFGVSINFGRDRHIDRDFHIRRSHSSWGHRGHDRGHHRGRHHRR